MEVVLTESMAKVTGFLEFRRETPAEREVEKRLQDWQALHVQMPVDRLQAQGIRCMDCGTPFCHDGRMLNGMTSGCPINNLIPEWNDLVFQGRWPEALERLHKTNNFPEFTGRVCPAPCEAACTLGIYGPPVTIQCIEKEIVEKCFSEGWIVPKPPPQRTGKRVAVVGSGPAGLACADQLNQAGHWVEVFERADRIGGLLMYGIPNMKLEKHVVQRRVDLLAAEGIIFTPNSEVGKNIPAAQLCREFDAVVLCTGATVPRDLPVDGRSLEGLHFAMEYLSASTRHLLNSGEPGELPLSAEGKDVIVIGGGDTGTDCVATALRQKCRSLAQFEILPQPPLQRAPDNPWPQWPKVYRMEYGQAEARAVFGRDPRAYSVMTKRFTGDEHGHVTAAHTVDVTWVASANGPGFREIPGSERAWPAQLVLLAMGFLGPEGGLLAQLGVERDKRSNAKAAYGKFATNVAGVFAAGDARRGQSLVAWAIAEGRGAARECDQYLMGQTWLP
jgi:glutamate synthase (NADPH/NADH) small chain